MSRKKMKAIVQSAFPAVCAAVLAAACNTRDAAHSDSSSPEREKLPASLIATVPLAHPESVVEARRNFRIGENVIVAGYIGGRERPFFPGRAIFTLADHEALDQCDSLPGGDCATPWDGCHEEPETIQSSIATVQALGADGRVIKRSFDGFMGLKPGSAVNVKGTVAAGSSTEALIINADKIYLAIRP